MKSSYDKGLSQKKHFDGSGVRGLEPGSRDREGKKIGMQALVPLLALNEESRRSI